MSDCIPCKALVCQVPDDLSYGSASSAIYARNQLSFLITGVAGCFAPAGIFPHVFTYLIDPIPPIIPSGGAGTPIVLRLQGCTSEIVRTVAADATQEVIEAAAAEVQSAWGQQQAACDARLLPGVRCGIFFNQAISFRCPGGYSLQFFGVAPSVTVVETLGGNTVNVFVTNLGTDTVFGNDFVFTNGVGAPSHGTIDALPGDVLKQVMFVLVGSPNAFTVKWGVQTLLSGAVFNSRYDITVVTYGNPFPDFVTFADATLTVAAGMFSGATQAEADARAQAYIDNLAANYIADHILACVVT
jgi:hypothetical protein